jgi:CRISPR-associated protein Cst1
MLKYTEHPLVDVGVATITAYAKKREPSQVTAADLNEFGAFMEKVYGNEWRKWMYVIFPNSLFTQTQMGEEKKEAARATFIYGHRALHEANELCVFCGQMALTRSFRQNVPLLTGEGMVNFFPQGDAGLPTCGTCLLAVQAFLLGSVRCHGRALFVHADDEAMTFEFAKRFLTENRRSLSLDLKHPRTFFVARLLEVEAERKKAELDETPCSVTVYHLTNYGTNADITLYHFPSQLVAFLRHANRAPHGDTWKQIERRAWELSVEKVKGKGRSKAAESPTEPQPREEPGVARNYLYEDLFKLPHEAARFVRTYFLRRAYRSNFVEDPRRAYNLHRELELVSWTLTAIFLEEVMRMTSHSIETIKRIADRIADHISAKDDKRLFRGLWMSRRPWELRRVLVREDTRLAQGGQEPLLTFDDFVTVFELSEDGSRPDWGLARDLILIRVIEQLHRSRWFTTHVDVIGDEEMPEVEEVAAE